MARYLFVVGPKWCGKSSTYGNEKIVNKENNKTHYERNFNTLALNQIWSTDISKFHIALGKLYLSLIIDVHSREIVFYVISRSPNFK